MTTQDPQDPLAFRHAEVIVPGYICLALIQRGRDYETYDAWSEDRYARCVVKVLRVDRRRSRSSRQRLLLEGRVLTTVQHPHIVRGYEVVAVPRVAVILETLGGATLRHVLRGGRRLSSTSVAHLGQQVASALIYLHTVGYLHLDVKPDNLIIDGWRARLIDLSLIQPPGAVPRGLGTPSYLSPEQGLGNQADERADVWGLGLTMYEAAVGANPYRATAATGGPAGDPAAPPARTDPVCSTCGRALTFPQVTERLPPIRTRRRLPRPLAEVIDAAVELQPENRPAMRDLHHTMRGLTGG